MIEFKIKPGSPVRNDPCIEQQLARRVSLALVMIEENPWRPVQLGNNYPLGTVDNEGPIPGHERSFPHVDFLFPDVFHSLG